MERLVFATGILAGLTLAALLAATLYAPRLDLWPTPAAASWQSRVFWPLFRALNVATLLLAALDFAPWQEWSIVRAAGALAALVGFGLYGLAVASLGRPNLYCGKDGLRTRGIYRFTRNPQYATAIPAYIGLALASQSPRVLALAVLLAAVFALMALTEEPWLESVYGHAYARYRRTVPRFYGWRRLLTATRLEAQRARRAATAPLRRTH